MSIISNEVALQAVEAGLASPLALALVLALSTLVLEDLAIAGGVALATQGLLSWPLALCALAGGIALGDLGLYALGALARRLSWLRQRFIGERAIAWRDRIAQRLPFALLMARVVPGLRLPAYSACGFLRVPFAPFAAWVLIGAALWTLGLAALGVSFGAGLSHQFGTAPALAVALPIVLLAMLPLALRAARSRTRLREQP